MPNDPVEIDTLEQHFEDVVRAMDSQFTSHEFFLRLAHDISANMLRVWLHMRKGGKPFQRSTSCTDKAIKNA